MTVNKQHRLPPVGGSLHRLARRVPALKAMPLNPIGDIATPNLTETTTVPITWETAADWDAAVNQSGVEHTQYEGAGEGEVRLGDLATDGDVTEWSTAGDMSSFSASQTQTAVGEYSHEAVSGGANSSYAEAETSLTAGFAPSELRMWAYVDNSNSGDYSWSPRWQDGSGNIIMGGWWDPGGGSGAGNVGVRDGNTWTDTGYSYPSQEWVRYRWANIDFGAETWDLYAMPIGQSEQLIYSNGNFDQSASNFSVYKNNSGYDAGETMYFNVYPLYVSSGSLTTATKSFGTANQPDLQNLDYDLNGESIDIEVIGDPAGTAETVTQTLDGSTSYTLTWSGSYTDFRVVLKPSTTDQTTTPAIRRVELL